MVFFIRGQQRTPTQSTPLTQMNYPTNEQVAAKLEQYARTIAPTVAFLIALAVHTYWAGYRLGRAVHRLSDWLAHHWPTRPPQQRSSTAAAQPASQPAQQQQQRSTAAQHVDALTARIQALRAQRLSQRRIAEICGVSRATVRRRLVAA